MKIVLSVIVLIAWAKLMQGNIIGAGLTASKVQLLEGISEAEAQRRTTMLVVVWAIVYTAAGVVALVLIW